MNITVSTSTPLIVAAIGGVVYALVAQRLPWLAELGRLAFAMGLLALLMHIR